MLVTVDILRRLGACAYYADEFAADFPEGLNTDSPADWMRLINNKYYYAMIDWLYYGADLEIHPNLEGMDLSGRDLSHIQLGHANLKGANLSGTNLSRAFLDDADLTGANLCGATLYCTSMFDAILTGADLTGVDMSDVYQ